jgi:hypothetical protein
VEKIKQLRTAADDAFRTGNTDIGRSSKAAATALEDAIESHLGAIGSPELLQQFRDARQLIAKTYSVQKALNVETGTVDARKLAAELQRGKPLSGGIKEAAQFAARFPKAAQTPEQMGSLPQWSPLDLSAGIGTAGIGGLLSGGNPLALAGLAAPGLVRSGARSLALSPVVQNGLVQSQGNAITRLLADPRFAEILQAGYRAAPVAVTSGGR